MRLAHDASGVDGVLAAVVATSHAVQERVRMFAGELESMMARMPLSKVRVADLCVRCGVERRVFYYHFKDKYDLVAWMFEWDRLTAAAACKPYTQAFYAESHRLIWARRDFYRRAFEKDTQNSIERYLLQFSVEANEAALKRHLGLPSSRASTPLRRGTLRMATWDASSTGCGESCGPRPSSLWQTCLDACRRRSARRMPRGAESMRVSGYVSPYDGSPVSAVRGRVQPGNAAHQAVPLVMQRFWPWGGVSHPRALCVPCSAYLANATLFMEPNLPKE